MHEHECQYHGGCAACETLCRIMDSALAAGRFHLMVSRIDAGVKHDFGGLRCLHAHIRQNWLMYMPFLVYCASHGFDAALFLLTPWVWDDSYDIKDWLGAEDLLGHHDAIGRPRSQFIQILRERLAPTTVAITGSPAMNPYAYTG